MRGYAARPSDACTGHCAEPVFGQSNAEVADAGIKPEGGTKRQGAAKGLQGENGWFPYDCAP